MEELGDLFSDPNGPAYTKQEKRQGPPLDYVQQKLISALEIQHRLIFELEQGTRIGGPPPGGSALDGEELSAAVGKARHSFYYQLVAFLALSNMLALANDSDLVDRLASHSREEFREWLESIQREGTVSESD